MFTSAIATAALAFSMQNAQATTINFDDLVYNPDQECFCDSPLTDEYLAKGLRIDGGFLAQSDSGNNFLFGSNWLQLFFVGSLPNVVNMRVSSALGDVIYLDAYGTAGALASKKTKGWAGPFDDTPYEPNQLISFSSSSGIASIVIQDFYNYRVDAQIDDLVFICTTAVPEPSPLLLFMIGCGAVIGIRRYRRK